MILVTGGAGYIGSITTAALLEAGRKVVVLDDLSTGHRDAVAPGVPFVEGDIADEAIVRDVIRTHGVTAVVHFAAKSIVPESTGDPLLYVRANTAKTASLLSSLQREGVRSIVFSSTAAVYGEPDAVPIPEDHPKRPESPYGLSKWWIEETLAWCQRAWELSWVALRYFNAAGALPSLGLLERHSPETHLLPRLIEAWRQGHPVTVYGTDYPTPDGTAVRDYVHVRDLASAHLLALDAVEAGRSGAYNVGTGKGHSVQEVVTALEAETGSPVARDLLPRRPGDPAILVADGTRIMRDLRWRPRESDIASIVRSVLETAGRSAPRS